MHRTLRLVQDVLHDLRRLRPVAGDDGLRHVAVCRDRRMTELRLAEGRRIERDEGVLQRADDLAEQRVAGRRVDLGMEGAQKMIAYTFAVVTATILLHGFSLAPMARMLGLRSDAKPGLLIVGGSLWTTALAEKVMAMGTPVRVTDDNWNHLAPSRQRNIPTYFGDVMSERAHNELNLHSWAACIAASDNTAYNALVCTQLGPEIGRNRVFQLGGRGENERRDLHFTIGGRPLTKEGYGFEALNERMLQGWVFTLTPITDEFGYEDFLKSRPEGTIILLWVRSSGEFRFASTDKESVPNPGNIVLTFGPKLRNSEGEALNAGNGKEQESGK